MKYISSYITDRGLIKKVNQDSLLIKEAVFRDNHILFAAVCDGMGGLSDGEIASGSVIHELSAWFENELPQYISNSDSILKIRKSVDLLLHNINNRINTYGTKNNKQLGTTLTAVLMMSIPGKMLICHVGDSRVYRITDDDTTILTHDHSVVENDVRNGKITIEQAKTDSRQNKLTKCIGSGLTGTAYDYIVRDIERDAVFMICSDGFRRKIDIDEISQNLSPSVITDDMIIHEKLGELLDKNLSRGETDNISALAVKVSDE